MNENQTEIKDLIIPPNALVTCPNSRYGLVSIAGCCLPCPHYSGLFDVLPTEAPFAVKYRVNCGMPQVREIVVADMGVTV